jgi:clan AA aspartic protease
MITGQFRDGHPRVELVIEAERLEFVVDTGFEGDLVLPRGIAARLFGAPSGSRLRVLADGNRQILPVHEVVLEWQGEDRMIEVLGLGAQPLIGTALLGGNHLHAELAANAKERRGMTSNRMRRS